MKAWRTITYAGERTPLKSISDLLNEAEKCAGKRKLWFRGHSSRKFELRPSVGRKQRFGGNELDYKPETERELLHRFRRRAFAQLNQSLDPWKAILVARHYDLPVRLLDWTENALVALFAAACAHPKDAGTLWALKEYKREDRRWEIDVFDPPTADPLDYPSRHNPPAAVKVLYPIFDSPRISAQGGVFTLHSRPQDKLEDYATQGEQFAAQHCDIDYLYSWSIPARGKRSLLCELARLGITRRSMYPDVGGIAQSLIETEILFNGENAT